MDNIKISDLKRQILEQNAKFVRVDTVNNTYNFDNVETMDLSAPKNQERINLANEYFKINNINSNFCEIEYVEEKDDTLRVGTKNVIYEFNLSTKKIKNLLDVNGKNVGRYYTYDENGNIIKSEIIKHMNMQDKNGSNYFNGYVSDKSVDLNYFNDGREYGGSQSNIQDIKVSKFFCEGEKIEYNSTVASILKNQFPSATVEQMKQILSKITSSSCGSVAFVNSIFEKYEGREKEFLETFGFSMYNVDEFGEVNYNYAPLVVDLYIYVNKSIFNKFYADKAIEKVFGAMIGQKSNNDEEIQYAIENFQGLTDDSIKYFSAFLKYKYKVNSTSTVFKNAKEVCNKFKIYQIDNEFIENLKKQGSSIFVGARNYDLYYANDDGTRGEKYIENGSAHAMSVTGITKEGDYIVSSWGKKFILSSTNEVVDSIFLIEIGN